MRSQFNHSRLVGSWTVRLCITAAVGFGLLTAAGCNAVKGLGRDVQALAQGGQDLIDGKEP